jgi:hypothetical protein
VPTPRPATINGVNGLGYATVTHTPGGLRDCKGVMLVDAKGAEAIIAADGRGDTLMFTGVVFDGARERQATFPVLARVDIDDRGRPNCPPDPLVPVPHAPPSRRPSTCQS